jgi:glycosyltransferase involved in cell wall biosynthesis
MRILIVTQYFWPENFKINDIALALKERGHEVLIMTGKPNYPNGKFSKGYTFFNKRIEFWNGIKIYRSPIIPRGKGKGIQLFVNYISFSIFASINLLFIKNKFDKIFVYEPSPITVGIPGIVAKYKFKAPLYFWVQDLWPESISAAGGINNKSVIAVLDWLTRFIYKHSKKVLVQSKAFIPYILNQNTEKDKLVYYPNSTENYYKELSADQELLKTLPKGIKLMFAGNIGEAQSFDTLLHAASILKKELIDVKWIILGDGRMKEYVNQKIKELKLSDNFYLLGSYPSTEMPKYFSCADALIVSLKKDPIFALTIPSKIQSYLACGKPIITSLDGEGSKIIEEAKAGFTSPSEDYVGLVANIKKFLTLSNLEQKVLGQNGKAYFDSEFEREILVDKLEEILNNDES